MKSYSRYGNEKNTLITIRLEKLRKLLEVLETKTDDYSRALELRRIYPSYNEFLKAYYLRTKFNESKTERITIINGIYSSYEDKLEVIRDLYKKYEEEGLFEKAKENDKFLLKLANNIDSRYIVNAYIFDSCSYDLDQFYKRYNIDREIFTSCVSRIKNNAPELYEKYLEALKNNKMKRLVMPIYDINQIVEGITTGKTIDGNNFDKYEFYRLAPFKDKDFDKEIRYISEDYPKLLIFKKLKQVYKRRVDAEHKVCTYADNLYLFTLCFSQDKADILRKWMEENNIKNLTPIHRASTVNCYSSDSSDEPFNRDDANELFDVIEEKGYPRIREVYNMLKEDKIKSKLTKKNN